MKRPSLMRSFLLALRFGSLFALVLSDRQAFAAQPPATSALDYFHKPATPVPVPASTPVPASAGSPSDSGATDDKPVIEFRVLLIIKQETDAYSPLFLPVRAKMTEADIAAARHCFEVETPDMVRDLTHGKVRFIPTVYISPTPLHLWNARRLDSAEYDSRELLSEYRTIAHPGDYDSVGCYFLHYDTASGYRAPRAGYGVGGFDAPHGMGLFAISSAQNMNPRDEIFLHEWMHGLEGFYGNKPGVKLEKGALHGIPNYPIYKSHKYRPEDTFVGWMDWYRDCLNATVKDGDELRGLGPMAWTYGPMRNEALKQAANYKNVPLPQPKYPQWVYDLMKGDYASAKLGAPVFGEEKLPPGDLDKTPWKVEKWSSSNEVQARVDASGAMELECNAANKALFVRHVALQPFKNYLLTLEVKTEGVRITQKGGHTGVHIEMGSSDVRREITGTTPWQKISLPFTTEEKTANAQLSLGLGGDGSIAAGHLWFRNVEIRQIGYPESDLAPIPGTTAAP